MIKEIRAKNGGIRFRNVFCGCGQELAIGYNPSYDVGCISCLKCLKSVKTGSLSKKFLKQFEKKIQNDKKC